jgi:hypothetical protein
MDTICLNDVKALIQNGGGAHVSIFMPTHHKGGLDQQDPIRFRNLLRTAEEKLVAKGVRPTEARSMLKPAEALLTDNLFWRQQSDGLAFFLAPNQYFYYRLPIELKEFVSVGERYSVSPVISLLSNCGLFYVLILSQDENRLLQCTSAGSVRINLSDIPKDMTSALHYEIPDSNRQFHTVSQISGSNFSGGISVQSEAGSRANYEKNNILQYFEQINMGVMKYLKEETAPMVMAGVDYLHPIYKTANTYRSLLAEGIKGNPNGVSDDTLREQAWTIVRPYFAKAQRDAIADFHKSAGTGLTATGLINVVTAAYQGRVRFLFIADGVQQWGSFNAETNAVTVHPNPEPADEDLLDFAAYKTLKHSGTVFVTKPEEVPGTAPISAILRF